MVEECSPVRTFASGFTETESSGNDTNVHQLFRCFKIVNNMVTTVGLPKVSFG